MAPDKLDYLIKGCTLTQLASLYLPDVLPTSALRTMRSWIAHAPGLRESLAATGFRERGKQRLTPNMVKIIFHSLGEP